MSRSPFLPVALAGVAVAAAAARWLVQGSGNLYTATSKRFYVPDPDVGWRAITDGPLWLGLEVIGLMVALVAAVAVAGFIIRRRERRRGQAWTWARRATWGVAALPLFIPVAAFATGLAPSGGREALPAGATASAPTAGIEGGLDVPAGPYQVVAGRGSSITAKLAAGGERFEARFAGDVAGTLTGDLRRLVDAGSLGASLSVDAASVDTGIELRSKHAREDYLAVGKFPRVTFTLGRLVAARQDGPETVSFRALGTVGLVGHDVPVEVTGTVRAASAEAAARLGVPGQRALIVAADTTLSIKGTPLTSDSTFDDAQVPLVVSLVLVPAAR